MQSGTPSQYGNFESADDSRRADPEVQGPDERGYVAPPSAPPTAPPLAVPYGYVPPSAQAPPMQPVIVVGAPGGNGLGIAGFVLSLVSLFMCAGGLWPISLGLSIAGMRREPKGLAIAGLVLSGVAAMLFLVMVLPFILIPMFVVPMAIASGPTMLVTSEELVLSSRVAAHVQATGSLPASLAAVAGVDASMTTDPWGTSYRLVATPDGGGFSIESAGPDGQFGTADDVVQQSPLPVGAAPPPAGQQPESEPVNPANPNAQTAPSGDDPEGES